MGWQKILGRRGMAQRAAREGGNAIAMIFMAIGMAGVVTYGLNNIMRGPAVTAAETARRTIAENNLVATTRLAIAASARQGSNNGDCDGDGFVEPIPFRTAVAPVTAPTGGGLLPMTLGATTSDPWGAQYGYCVWDPGTVSKSDAKAECGGAGANRLQGAPRDDQPAIAVISAGKDGSFQTTCAAYVDTTPADGKPDAPMVVKAPGSDDVVLTYTYAEANGVGGGLWKLRSTDAMDPGNDIAEIGMNIESTSSGGATFEGKVELKNKGLVLPGDPGDDTVTGACDAGKDGQMRRNTSTNPPTLEMCDFTNGGGWTQITGSAAPEVFNPKMGNCTSADSGPFVMLDEIDVAPAISAVWTKIGQNGSQTVFTGNANGAGVSAYNFDGSGFTLRTNTAGGLNQQIDGYDNFIFTTGGIDHKVRAYSWNGTALTLLDDIDTVDHAWGLWATPGRIYTVQADGVVVYDFNGSTLTESYKGGPGAGSIWTDGAYLYTGGIPARIREWDGSTVNVLDTLNNGGEVWGDKNYVYFSHQDGNGPFIYARTFDGTTTTTHGTTTIAAGSLWSDGVHVFAISSTDKALYAFKFDGTNFTLVNSIPLTFAPTVGNTSVYGDGNYIYATIAQDGGATGKMWAFGGFGCNAPAVAGGYVKPKPTPVSAEKEYVPEPLDVGLIAHWKMDEESGTTILDSVGTNNGTLLNNATRAAGQSGSGAVHFNIATRDAIQIPGYLGSPTEITVAGWVNISELDTGANASEIFSIGLNVYLRYNQNGSYEFGYWNGSTWEAIYGLGYDLNDGWHYVTGTISPSGNKTELYIDGVKLAESTVSVGVSYTAGSPDTFFGRHGGGNTSYDFTGSVDDFRVYSRALGASEIKQLYERAKLEAKNADPVKTTAPALSTDNKLSASSDYSCGIKKDGSLWCWGRDWPNQTLGNGPNRIQQAAPVQVTEPDAQVYFLTATDSDITSWGGGTALFQKTLSPFMTTAKTSFTISDLASPSGADTSYAFTPPGMPAQMPTTTENYKLILNLSPANKAHCLQTYNYVERVNSAGNPVGGLGFWLFGQWLQGGTGQSVYTGSGSFNGTFNGTDRIKMDFRFVPGDQDASCTGSQTFDIWGELHVPRIEHGTWTSVTTSSTHACGLKSDGSAWCWGMDSSDSLGNSGFASGLYDRPSRVVDTGVPWRQITAGTEHTCGIQANGTLWCWGGDVDGQLGNGAPTGLVSQPGQVGSATGWASVTAGENFTCAIDASGRAWCWGDDSYGQLGNGAASTADQVSPYLLPDPGPWVKISAGKEHVCGIKSDSTAWCWGHSTARELGIDSSSNQTAPTKISKPDGWIDISAGSFFTCGVHRDGKTYCWGEFNNGRLGNSTVTADNFYPTAVLGSQGSTSVTAGGDHACLTKLDGSVMCWGNDTYGQLGNGTGLTATQTTPTIVDGFANAVSWTWNDAASIIMAPFNMNLGLNGNILGATAARGFGFTSPGRAYLVQDVDSNQLLIENAGLGSSQLSFNAAAPPTAVDFTTSLATKWTFDDPSNRGLGSAAGTNGTLSGSPVANDKGRIADSLVFDGVDDIMTVPNSATVRPAAVTVAAWVKPAALQTHGAKIIYKTNISGNPTYGLSLSDTGGWVTFEVYTTDNTLYKIESTVPLTANAWNYVVGVYNRNSSPRYAIYVNGRNTTGIPTAPPFLSLSYTTTTPAGDLYIGSDSTGAKKFKGEIDDLRIYSARLSDAEVMRLYTSQIAQNTTKRSLGINWLTNNFELHPNPTGASMDQRAVGGYMPDMALNSTGNLGVGTYSPAARLDVAGSVRFGSEDICDSNRAGAMRYTGGTPPWSYCNGTAWTNFPSLNQMGWKKDRNALSVGDGYVCAIAQTGKLYCWGANVSGRLGTGLSGDTTLISEVNMTSGLPGWSDWKFVTGNVETTCGIRTNGTLWCWGRNQEGQLGDGTVGTDSYYPVQVKDDAGTGYWSDWTYVTAGQYNVCGIRTNGKLYCWGEGYYGSNADDTQNSYYLPHETVPASSMESAYTDWKTVDMFLTTGCGTRANGTIYCWGDNSKRGVGDNTATTPRMRPVRVHDTSGAPSWTDWVEVTAGNNVSCGRRTTGQAFCWGVAGRRGDNSADGGAANGRPQVIHNDGAPASWLDWKYITAGYENACAIRTNGQLYCWGDDTYQQMHYTGGKLRPYRMKDDVGGAGWTDWVTVKTGMFTICGVRADSSLWCWGYSDFGNGNGSNSWTTTYPTKVNSP